MPDPLRDYLTVAQLRDALGVSRALAYRLVTTLPDRDVVRSAAGVLVHRRSVERLRQRNSQRGRPRKR